MTVFLIKDILLTKVKSKVITAPECITEADTVNISVTPILKSVEEAKQALEKGE